MHAVLTNESANFGPVHSNLISDSSLFLTGILMPELVRKVVDVAMLAR